MSEQTATLAAIRPPLSGAAIPSLRYVVGWALGCAAVGCVVAVAIVLNAREVDLAPALLSSVLFAEAVGFNVLTSTRLVFPLFGRFPAWLQAMLQVVTLVSAALFGSAAAIAVQPLFILARPATAITIVGANSVVAVLVGIALHTYDTMRRQIEASYRMLREKERLERELTIARDVQRELLPRVLPDVAALELAAACHPAVGVGGDYYDILQFDESRLGLVIADVSGKGVPAALLMAGLQSAVRSIARSDADPGDVQARINNMLYRSSSSSRYATMFLGLYDGESGKLVYANAGHHPPLIVGDEGAARLDERGLPVGMFEDSRYRPVECRLRPGDLLVMFTDGVSEAPRPDGEEYGEERLVELLRRHRAEPLERIVEIILESLDAWTEGGEAHDDVTVVLARAR
jgi:sigma-B regulation protein RsbU (phosphoserine phosphatase)